MKDIELAYIAGLVDADGCIGIYIGKRGGTRNVGYIYVSVTNRDIEVLDWLKENFDGTVCNNGNSNPNWTPCFKWHTAAKKAYDFLNLIYPFLRIKRKQAVLAIDFRDLKTNTSGRVLPVEELKFRESYKNAISDLNNWTSNPRQPMCR